MMHFSCNNDNMSYTNDGIQTLMYLGQQIQRSKANLLSLQTHPHARHINPKLRTNGKGPADCVISLLTFLAFWQFLFIELFIFSEPYFIHIVGTVS